MSRKLNFGVLCLVLSIMLISMTNVQIATAKEVVLPMPTGLYKVGVEWLHWADDSRAETFDKAPHGKREMMIEVLYPASPMAGAKTATYMVNKKVVLSAFTELASENGIAYAPKVNDVANLQTHSYLNAPLSGGKHNIQYWFSLTERVEKSRCTPLNWKNWQATATL